MRIWPMYEWLSRASKTRRANVFTEGLAGRMCSRGRAVLPSLAQNYLDYFNIWIRISSGCRQLANRGRHHLREIALLLPTGVWSPLQHLRCDLVDAAIDQRGRSA